MLYFMMENVSVCVRVGFWILDWMGFLKLGSGKRVGEWRGECFEVFFSSYCF